MTDRKCQVSGVRLTGRERRIALQLGNGNISQGVRFALHLADNQQAKPAKLSTILRSAAVMAAAIEEGKT
jgi:hypothetical protein